jgi:HEPN domain-containing protein
VRAEEKKQEFSILSSLNRKELQALSRIRLREARALTSLGMHDGAYYLAGYCVECALKACIAKMTQRHDFPDKRKADSSYTHSVEKLLKVAELEEARAEEARRDAAFRDNWDRVQWWSEQSRYSTTSAEAARGLIEAVSDRNHGVLRWLEQYWWP